MSSLLSTQRVGKFIYTPVTPNAGKFIYTPVTPNAGKFIYTPVTPNAGKFIYTPVTPNIYTSVTPQCSHIVLMLADDMACNARNPKPATVFSHKNMELNVYGDDVEVDYRSYEVTVENFLRVLTGRVPPSTPRSKRLLSDDRSNILIYMTGCSSWKRIPGGEAPPATVLEAQSIFVRKAVCGAVCYWKSCCSVGRITSRYNELLFIIDTCQGASMYERFYSPNIMALASSQVGEDSLSHQPDPAIGVHLMDSNEEHEMVEEPIDPLKYAEQLPVAQIIHQKPKPKDWHPPGGFILGLWSLIVMVFFKTYGIKHMKFIF
ncbi:GPI-anchor transamidase [Cricetulus griseus]|uniref:GPI-anchor transamidase n=1 Tax=Cricetulus griseus TaxID=10029 RepID=G3GVT9_CRIGR|nr:GPI-anchor transamidase [Cricetulus griseus]